MLKRIITITVSSFVSLTMLFSTASAATDEALIHEWYPDYDINQDQIVDGKLVRIFDSLAGGKITISREFEDSDITVPVIGLAPIDQTDYDWEFESPLTGEIYDWSKIVPNGFGYNWADVGVASTDVTVIVDGEQLDFADAEPFIDINGRTMVPVRSIAEALGATVEYSASNPSHNDYMYWFTKGREMYTTMEDPEGVFALVPVYIDTGDIWVDIYLNGICVTYGVGNYQLRKYNRYDYSESWIPVDTAGFLKNDRTYVPLRVINEALGATVEWDNETHTVTITSPEPVEPVAEPEIGLRYSDFQEEETPEWLTKIGEYVDEYGHTITEYYAEL